MKLLLGIEIEGEDESDLTTALEVVLQQLENGCTSGFDRNETGRFRWTMTEASNSPLPGAKTDEEGSPTEV